MITPAVSLNSIQPRNPVQELTLTSTRSESSSDLTQVERPSQSAILPAQIVSVTTLSEEVAPTDENEAAVGDRALGAQDSSFAQLDPGEETLQVGAVAESRPTPVSDDESDGEDIQADIDETRERTAESLAEFEQTMNEVNQRLVEVNQRLAELGVLEEIYQTGSVLQERA